MNPINAAISIRHVDPQGADALALLREASADARALYPELFVGTASATNGPLPAGSVHVVACAQGQPLACGAIYRMDETVAEVKRMYAHRAHPGASRLSRFETLVTATGRTPRPVRPPRA